MALERESARGGMIRQVVVAGALSAGALGVGIGAAEAMDNRVEAVAEPASASKPYAEQAAPAVLAQEDSESDWTIRLTRGGGWPYWKDSLALMGHFALVGGIFADAYFRKNGEVFTRVVHAATIGVVALNGYHFYPNSNLTGTGALLGGGIVALLSGIKATPNSPVHR